MDFSNLSSKDQEKMSLIIQQKQVKDFMRLYSSLVDRCFNDCVNDFTSQKLTGNEDKCLGRCMDKFIKHSERVGLRFAEQNEIMMKQGMKL